MRLVVILLLSQLWLGLLLARSLSSRSSLETNQVVFQNSKMSVSRAHDTSFFRVETKKEKEWESFRSTFLPFFLKIREKYGRAANKQTEFISKEGGSGRVEFLRTHERLKAVQDYPDIFDAYFSMLTKKMAGVFAQFLDGPITEDDLNITAVDSFCIYREKGGHHYYHTHYAGREVNWVAVWYLAVPEDKDHNNRLFSIDFVEKKESAILAEEGDLLIHPAWVSHGTEEIKWEGVRAVFATNLEVKFLRKDNLEAKLVKKPYNFPQKAQKIHPFPLYFFQLFSPPGDLIDNYFVKREKEDKQIKKEEGEKRGKRRRRRRAKGPAITPTADEDIKEWVKITGALGISEMNIQRNREREKASKHFSHAFGECHFETSKEEIRRDIGFIHEQRFTTFGTHFSPMDELKGDTRQNVNQTAISDPDPYSIFYFHQDCQEIDVQMKIGAKKFSSVKVPEYNEITKKRNFDTIMNSILNVTNIPVTGGKSVILPSPILHRLSLEVSDACNIFVFHFYYYHKGRAGPCHLQ